MLYAMSMVPEDLTPDAILRAKEERGLTYKAIADAVDVTVQAVFYWSRGTAKPSPAHHAALRRVLYGTRIPERTVWFRRYGHRYRGRVTAIRGKTAHVRFRLRSGEERDIIVDPRIQVVLLNVDWADTACQTRGLGPLQDVYQRQQVTLREDDFETQALANTLQRRTPDLRIDRGNVLIPEHL